MFLTPSEYPRRNGPQALALCAANWIVPGLGFLLAGDRRRALWLFGLINGVFVAGLAFNGYIYMPPMSPRAPDFNIVATLTFIVQACNAGFTMMILWAGKAGVDLLARPAGAAFADLGAFHLLVSGGLNYFATVRLYDLLTGRAATEEKGEDKAKPSAAEPEES